jgi:hypothetical protein
MSTANPVMSGAVTTVLVLAIILGAFGLLGNLIAIGTVALSSKIQQITNANMEGDANNEAYKNFQAATNRTQLLGLPGILVKMVLSVLIAWSAIGVFRRVECERERLRKWFLIAMCVEPFILVLTFYGQYQMLEPTREFYQATIPQFANMTGGFMIAGAAYVLLWSTAKLVFFWIGRRALAA